MKADKPFEEVQVSDLALILKITWAITGRGLYEQD
jgi:hypothetical protein